MNDTLYITSNFEHGFNMVDNDLINSPQGSFDLKFALIKIFNLARQNPLAVMTQKLFSARFGVSRYKTKQIFDEAEKLGYVTKIKIMPHQRTDADSEYSKNGWIQYIYIWYMDPSKNKDYKRELKKKRKDDYKQQAIERKKKKMLSKVEDFKNQYDLSTSTIEQTMSISVPQVSEKELYKAASDRFKNSVFYDVNSEDLVKTELAPELISFRQENVTGEECNVTNSMEPLLEVCWNLIVRADSYNDETYKSYRYSSKGIEMANSVKTLLLNKFNSTNIYNAGLSNIPEIKNDNKIYDSSLGKLLLYRFSTVIANYVNLGYLLNNKGLKRIPSREELTILYETLEKYPELICLDYSNDSYLLFDKFYKAQLKIHNL